MKAIKAIFVIALLGALLAGGIGLWAYNDLGTPHEHQMLGKTVNIPSGSSTEQIVELLQKDGIIANAQIFKLYIKLQGVGSQMQAGDYTFSSPISPKEVLTQLLEGGQAQNKLTIIEGWTRWDIANAMAAIPSLHLKNANQALTLMNDTSSIKDLDPTATSLEGYMFPDTYFVQSTTTAKQLLESSVDHFHQVWKKDLADLANTRSQSAHDVVTIASIIETEAKLPEERPMMASVMYNRLGKNIPLGVDSTIVYASKMAGKWHNNGIVYMSDINRKSPYNTRQVAGLPPGPVSNPGLSSMKAALQPTNTGFIYYVREPSRNDGAHNFYIDAAGFEVGVAKLRAWERANRGKSPTTTTATTTTTTSNTVSQPSASTLKPVPGLNKPTQTTTTTTTQTTSHPTVTGSQDATKSTSTSGSPYQTNPTAGHPSGSQSSSSKHVTPAQTAGTNAATNKTAANKSTTPSKTIPAKASTTKAAPAKVSTTKAAPAKATQTKAPQHKAAATAKPAAHQTAKKTAAKSSATSQHAKKPVAKHSKPHHHR